MTVAKRVPHTTRAMSLVLASGPQLAWVLAGVSQRTRPAHTRRLVAGAAVASLAALVGMRSFELVSDRFQLHPVCPGVGRARSFRCI